MERNRSWAVPILWNSQERTRKIVIDPLVDGGVVMAVGSPMIKVAISLKRESSYGLQ